MVRVQIAWPLASVLTGVGHVENSPGGPLIGGRSEHVNPATGVPFVVATTVTMNVEPGETERVERLMLRVKAVAVLPAVGVSVAISVAVAVAAPLGDVPLMTGPLGDVPDDCPLASV